MHILWQKQQFVWRLWQGCFVDEVQACPVIWTLLGAPGLTTRSKKLLGAKGIATRSKFAFISALSHLCAHMRALKRSHRRWSKDTIQMNLRNIDVPLAQVLHYVRDAWRSWCFNEFIYSGRHEVQDLQHTTLDQLQQLNWARIRSVAGQSPGCRTVATGASVSPAWTKQCPWCNEVLGGITWRGIAALRFDIFGLLCRVVPATWLG